MAPAPTGRLHLGTARTTLHNWLFARHHRGTSILRIEDTDQTRSSQESVDSILEDVRWLGLDWDEGPGVDAVCGPYFQSQRLDLYRRTVDQLLAQGDAYPCYCTPEELEQRRREAQSEGGASGYDRRCRDLSGADGEQLEAEGRPKAIRFAMPLEGSIGWDDLVRGEIEFQNQELEDFVMVKSDGFPSYLLACPVDDAKMAISHVLRGEDMISVTPRQLHVYRALGLAPPLFGHLPLILGPDRAKLSKRHGATSVTEFREQGYVSEAMVNFIALLGWSPKDDREILSREEMIQAFSLEGIGKSGAVFDAEKLEWMNGTYLRQMSPDDYIVRARPYLESAVGPLAPEFNDDYVSAALLLEQERAKTLRELPELTGFFFRDPAAYDEKGERKWFRREGAADLIAGVCRALEETADFTTDSVEAAVRAVAESLDVKAAPVIHTTRLAATGRTTGPGLFELLAVLGRERVLGRLKQAERYVRSLA
jgi:glutamyl-tRNA synthetase